MIPKTFNEEDVDIVIDEIVNDKDIEESDTEIETSERLYQ